MHHGPGARLRDNRDLFMPVHHVCGIDHFASFRQIEPEFETIVSAAIRVSCSILCHVIAQNTDTVHFHTWISPVKHFVALCHRLALYELFFEFL